MPNRRKSSFREHRKRLIAKGKITNLEKSEINLKLSKIEPKKPKANLESSAA